MQPTARQPEDPVIAIDWGTSSLRAALMSPDGAVIGKIATPDGIMFAGERSFEAIFRELFGPWLAQHPRAQVLASGMIGSRQGWVEAPYVACPAGFRDLADALTLIDVPCMTRIGLIPGLSIEHAGVPDVIRGEETQVFGALTSLGVDEGIFVLPGTHSKWVTVEGGRIIGFRTFLTGEMFDVLRRYSILGRLMTEAEPAAKDGPSAAFDLGYDLSRQGHLLHHLFSVRSRGLFGSTAPADLPDYMSGLLIGEEIREATALIDRGGRPSVYLLGRGDLAGLYRRALAHHGIEATVLDDGMTFAGLFALARMRNSRTEV